MDASIITAEAACAQGRFDDAVGLCRRILAESPHDPAALNLLGIIAQRQGKQSEALAMFDAALTAKPDFLQARYNRSIILRLLDRKDEALDGLKAALQQSPEFAEAWDLAGQLFMERCAYDDAAKCLGHATGLSPNNGAFWANLGLLHYARGNFLEAYRAARRANDLDPTAPPFLLGNALLALGYPEEAASCFEQARATPALSAHAAASEAMARLQMGDFERGFPLWEKRPLLDWKHSAAPLWNGASVETLLLYEDQGFGDAIQFLRFVPQVQARARHIVLCLRAPLVALCAQHFPEATVCAEGDPLPPVTARCRLSSLPSFVNLKLSSLSGAPYLSAPADSQWRQRLTNIPHPRIGIVWAGNSRFHNDGNRSIDVNSLSPLLKHHARFVSLQMGHGKEAKQAGFFDAAKDLHSFADTAALMNELDLVVSVDTAVAHLAGAMGKPVFILLPFTSDWRWLLGRSDSPWYATAKLFRQTAHGDWAAVIAAVTADIDTFVAGNADVLKATPRIGDPVTRHPYATRLP